MTVPSCLRPHRALRTDFFSIQLTYSAMVVLSSGNAQHPGDADDDQSSISSVTTSLANLLGTGRASEIAGGKDDWVRTLCTVVFIVTDWKRFRPIVLISVMAYLSKVW
jgi:hypothetical protein